MALQAERAKMNYLACVGQMKLSLVIAIQIQHFIYVELEAYQIQYER